LLLLAVDTALTTLPGATSFTELMHCTPLWAAAATQ
jgi:hypothetical protein